MSTINMKEEFIKGRGGMVTDGCFTKGFSELITSKDIDCVVYEVIRVFDGKPLFLADHINRLEASLQHSGCSTVSSTAVAVLTATESVKKLVDLCNLRYQNIKILLIPSEDPCKPPKVIAYPIESFYPPMSHYNNGVKASFLRHERKNPNAKVVDASLKKTMSNAMTDGVFELLLVNDDGKITEGSRSNVFYIKHNCVYTAPDSLVLQGITRSRIIELCESLCVRVIYQTLPVKDLLEADAVFISSTSNGILPIGILEGRHYDIRSCETLKILMNAFFAKEML